MELNTPITATARRIARESQTGRRIYFDREGGVIVRIVGPDAYGPSSYAVYANGKISQRAAQDQLDAKVLNPEAPSWEIAEYAAAAAHEREAAAARGSI